MTLLVSVGFGFGALKGHPVFGMIAAQVDHVPWEGTVFWDLIQPAFMFMVGIAMPFALARRMEQGEGFRKLWRHVALRSLRLLVLSEIIMCIQRNRVHLQLTNVLAQIAFTYFLCFLIMQLRFSWQVLAAAALVVVPYSCIQVYLMTDNLVADVANGPELRSVEVRRDAFTALGSDARQLFAVASIAIMPATVLASLLVQASGGVRFENLGIHLTFFAALTAVAIWMTLAEWSKSTRERP